MEFDVYWQHSVSQKNEIRRARPLLGTFVEIRVEGGASEKLHSAENLHAAIDRAFAAIELVHGLMSWHDPNSDLSRLNREAHLNLVKVHPWTYEVLEKALELSELTHGHFDITIAPELIALGYLPGMGLELVKSSRYGDFRAIELLENYQVRFRSRILIDLGGIAKGFAVDKAVESLEADGINRGCVNAGGDLRVFGAYSEPVMVRTSQGYAPLLMVEAGALATSGPSMLEGSSGKTAANNLVRGTTRKPIANPSTVSVRAESCLLADALTKVVSDPHFGSSELLALLGASAYKIENNEIYQLAS